MTLQELKETDWYKERPELIKQAMEILPPIQQYRFKDSKEICFIVSIKEPESNKLEDVTLTVQKIGQGGVKVFEVHLNDLEPI
jgi:hypothetical protein